MAEPGVKLVNVLLDRLYATLVNGPLMSCRPHSSRQRVDLFQLAKLQGPDPRGVVAGLLGGSRSVKLVAGAEIGERRLDGGSRRDGDEALIAKLRTIAEDARTYEEDTGTQALYVGFPLLNLPPEASATGRAKRRILAPLAFVPSSITIKATRPVSVTLEAIGEGADLVVPNSALITWVERVTGKDLEALFVDEGAADPWKELNDIVAAVTNALELRPFPALSPESELVPTPRADGDAMARGIVPSAVIGLFPAANQGLLSDLEALSSGSVPEGPIEGFLRARADLGERRNTAPAAITTSLAGSERCVSEVDPCQARAVHLARTVNGLVIHGPPGTGKSQTITNIIGDHLAHGERVLFVCDKRTAVDVVAHRLEGLGLGSLCAVVHDARRDQRELYRGIREQLDALAETTGRPSSLAELAEVDAEIARLHAELTEHERALSERPTPLEPSFHELVGAWLALGAPGELPDGPDLSGVRLAELLPLENVVREVMERGLKERYAQNAWTGMLRADVHAFLAVPHADWEARVRHILDRARRVDACIVPGAPPLSELGDVREQGRARRALGELVQAALSASRSGRLAAWLLVDSHATSSARADVQSVEGHAASLAAPSDRELDVALGAGPALADIGPWLLRLSAYLSSARKWYGFLFFGRRRAAREVLARLGLPVAPQAAERAARFLERLRARRVVESVVAKLTARNDLALSDAALMGAVAEHAAIFRAIGALEELEARDPSMHGVRRALADAAWQPACLQGLLGAEARANAIAELDAALYELGLLTDAARGLIGSAARRSEPVSARAAAWLADLPSVEGLLRLEGLLSTLPPPIVALLRRLLHEGATPDRAWAMLYGAALRAEALRRLHTQPALTATDGARVQAAHERYRDLAARRRELVRDVVQHVWVTRQRERLLASTGSRLNNAGAEIRRRLVSRGERALRVRQMIQAGTALDGGDPLFDLRPVWMASPDVVAQIFPRAPLFDVVIFDEASQCRLEEAIPVLLRAKRVVIAGDPQQLPPTRFFETGVSESQDYEAEDEQGLFEARQAEVEDLLGAALNLSVEQAYLDVHYRSRNADLIEFSNEHFYESRLQAIPAHPSTRSASPPLRLVRVNGVYENRANAREAEEVVAIVRRLLAEPSPPSIGIACFNLSQRDAIVEALDRAAAEDGEFGARLATARARQGQASFEGLFVRNLENVQGDERDHVIISTTYGPDAQGRFYRRFGPLGQAGGGRRLNVLVTRARAMVHLVTSIPREIYQARPTVPAGTNPNGAWLLFAYLAYAEELERKYAEAREQARALGRAHGAECLVFPSKYPSELAAALGRHLRDAHGISSWVHWGNDGFAVDAALLHPERANDVTIGVLCDGSRFAKAADRVQWDMFRTEVLRAQRWRLLRLWSPQLFRDPSGAISALRTEMQRWLAEEATHAATIGREASVTIGK